MTSHCHSAAPLSTAAAVLSSILAPLAPSCSSVDGGEECGLLEEPPAPTVISPPCSPYIRGEDETLLDDEEKLIILNNVWNQKEREKGNDFTAKREEEVNNTFLKTENEIKAEALGSSLETKEKDLSMLPEKQSKIEKREILSLVGGGHGCI